MTKKVCGDWYCRLYQVLMYACMVIVQELNRNHFHIIMKDVYQIHYQLQNTK